MKKGKIPLLLAAAVLAVCPGCGGDGVVYMPEEPPEPSAIITPSAGPAVSPAPSEEEPSPEPSYLPEQCVLTLTDGSGRVLDVLTLTVDGVRPERPLDAVYGAGRIYIDGESLFDLCERNGYSADFGWEEGTISLFSGHERPGRREAAGEKNALLRLEDIAAFGPAYSGRDDLLKLRAMADLMWEYGAAFSIAWVPLYVRPAEEYTVDVMNEYTRYNAEFVFTVDYMISRGGVLGLHGYTHQSGAQNSVAGTEFGPGINESEEATRERYELAIGAAGALGWEAWFFEFPHYASTKRQSEILEEYFDIIYTRPYNKWPSSPYYVENGDRTAVYLHTPQDYVLSGKEEDVARMVSLIKNAGAFCSLFYHPTIEYTYISVTRGETGPPTVNYQDFSPLRRILDAFEAGGRTARSPLIYSPTVQSEKPA